MRMKLLVTKYEKRKWMTNVAEGTKATRKKDKLKTSSNHENIHKRTKNGVKLLVRMHQLIKWMTKTKIMNGKR